MIVGDKVQYRNDAFPINEVITGTVIRVNVKPDDAHWISQFGDVTQYVVEWNDNMTSREPIKHLMAIA